MNKPITIALAGNPNSGKTTLFNAMTGARQHVANYPGVTVEIKEGACRHKGQVLKIVDLPGTYSLTVYSEEELEARKFILERRPDVVIDVIDATNPERHLFLATQLMELGVPVVLAFNMNDLARARGVEFDLGQLSRLLGVPIVPTVGHKGEGLEALLDEAVALAGNPFKAPPIVIPYGLEIEKEIARLEAGLRAAGQDGSRQPMRWTAVKLLEQDAEALRTVSDAGLRDETEKARTRIAAVAGDGPEIVMADRRYGFISGACQETIRYTVEARHTTSDQIDFVLTHHVLGFPIFMGLMYLVFQLTFTLGSLPMDALDQLFQRLGGIVSGWWPEGSESLLRSLLVDGIIGGVGGVLVFLPNILLLFLAIAVLEDSGYMARAAFIMDRLMHKIGLHGKSFIPMLIGFGCSVPAILATRMLESRRDRMTTMLVLPLISCGARLPIYALIIPAFFPSAWQGRMLWIIYMIGIALAVLGAKLMRSTFFRGETAPLVMELPPYRVPTWKGLAIHMWQRGWLYVQKAGTVILGISIVLWALTSFPRLPAEQKQALPPDQQRTAELLHSAAGRMGQAMEPVLKPMGFDWRIGTALIGAFAAKEVFVAQMGIVFAVGDADETSEPLRQKLRDRYSPLVGFCIMLFTLIGAPCMATIAATRSESRSWGWALFQLGGLTILAYVVTAAVYQVGQFMQWGV
ncbi:MAG TPA: ferrous iron transport protein B [Verrucomicrobia bacterium]|nr:MAG: ferrous iron transport protein B [Lentisphaerae bacterium GWF2_57_35]HBA82798.1 ferrous iron transport protein B [Verrucomicrobiota bacterium]